MILDRLAGAQVPPGVIIILGAVLGFYAWAFYIIIRDRIELRRFIRSGRPGFPVRPSVSNQKNPDSAAPAPEHRR